MKRFMLVLLAAALAFSLVSCNGILPGIGNDSGSGDAGVPPKHVFEVSSELGWSVDIEWMDFVRVGGVLYDGGFSSETVDGSRVGELIGKIEHNVKSSYESEAEFNADGDRDMSSFLRPIGCEVYKIIDDEYSVAILDGGKFYLYTCSKDSYITDFTVRGYDSLGGYTGEGNRGLSINSLEALKREFDNDDILNDAKFSEFTDDYFSMHTLVIATFETGWGGTEIGISSIAKSGDDLHVSAVALNSNGEGDDAMHSWMFFISIPKTDDKKVNVTLENSDPLSNGVTEIKYEDISPYMNSVDYNDLRVYEGKAILFEAQVRELVYSMHENAWGIKISYEPTQMYWFAEFNEQFGCEIWVSGIVIRAADGKIVAGR